MIADRFPGAVPAGGHPLTKALQNVVVRVAC